MLQTDWRQVVTEPSEKKLFEALEDPKWEWRTLAALSRVSGLPQDRVKAILAQYSTLVRKSAVPSTSGEELFTLQSRYFDRKSILEKVWSSLST